MALERSRERSRPRGSKLLAALVTLGLIAAVFGVYYYSNSIASVEVSPAQPAAEPLIRPAAE